MDLPWIFASRQSGRVSEVPLSLSLTLVNDTLVVDVFASFIESLPWLVHGFPFF